MAWCRARNGSAHLNNVELGRHGRNRTNVWRYAGATSVGKARNRALALHPTVKPVALVADAIKDCSMRGDIVLDPFAGSGTTLAAAHQTGRRCFGIELDPQFVDTTIDRLKRSFGLDARLQATGEAFDEVRKSRIGGR
jgi:DNA modification methylase